ncbi:acyl-CoA dehydrogenase family protein [Streptomyces sp. NBC_00285]|uniref:acyl-CoA dehydrogenase family protein n=1 Tax=Streptomyces sp. NBC_00285 TaxID=2975700 RepID=UPI002E2DE243|nr:acyl-CoA dehydrogenase family protein [Streptomyces sp. NBC_00285]
MTDDGFRADLRAFLADQHPGRRPKGPASTEAAGQAVGLRGRQPRRLRAVQIHGGYGYVRESEISRFHADAKILEIGEGTNEIQRNIIARARLSGRPWPAPRPPRGRAGVPAGRV